MTSNPTSTPQSKTLGKSIKGIFVRTLMLLLALSFVAWGIGDVFTGGLTQGTVAEVGNRKITTTQLKSAFEENLRRIREEFSMPMDTTEAVKSGMLSNNLRQLTEGATLDAEAENLGLAPNATILARLIAEEAAFKNEEGKFDPVRYKFVLERNDLTEPKLLEIFKEHYSRAILQSMFAPSVLPPSTVLEPVYSVSAESRAMEFAHIAYEDVVLPPVTEADIQAYFDKNRSLFQSPEKRRFQYAAFDLSAAKAAIALTDQDIADEYEKHKAEFTTPAKRSYYQIIAQNTEEADKVLKALQAEIPAGNTSAGNDAVKAAFTKVAADVLQDAHKAIFEDNKGKDDVLPTELSPALFDIDQRGYQAIAETPLGHHVLYVTDSNPEVVQSLAEVKDSLRNKVLEEKAGEAMFSTLNALNEKLSAGSNLETAASELGISLQTKTNVTQFENTEEEKQRRAASSTPPAQDPEYYAQIATVAFEMQTGGTSGLRETPEGAYFVVQMDSIIPTGELDFAAAKVDAAATLERKQQQEKAESLIAEIKAKVLAGETLQQSAKSIQGAKVTYQKVESFTKDSKGLEKTKPLPPANVLAAVFDITVPKAAFDAQDPSYNENLAKRVLVQDFESGATLVVLNGITSAALDAENPELQSLKDRISQQYSSEWDGQLMAALAKKYPVRVNQKVLDTLYPITPEQ